MITIYMFNRIRRLTKQGLNKSEIAKELGLHRNTVTKYVESNTPPHYPKRRGRTRSDPFELYSELTKYYLNKNPTNTAREIYELLVEQGYRGSERTVHRRIAEILGQKPKERFFEQEYEPAEQSQFDFKECVELPFVDGPRIVHFHFGTLPCSGTCWVRAYPFRVYECFMDGVHSFFEKIGGMTHNIRIDNLAPCVKKVLKGNDRLYTAAFDRAIEYYDFGVLPCAPGKGSDKGDVERDIRTFSNRIKNLVKNKDMVFENWEDLNTFLDQYMTKRQSDKAQALFAEEKNHLLPLPSRNDDILCKIEIGSSNAYGTLRFQNSAYSIPDHMIQVNCKTLIGAYDVKIYRGGGNREWITTHSRKPDGHHSILLEHTLPSLVRKPQAMVRWAHRGILFPSPVFLKFYRKLKKIDPSGAEREFLRAVNLVQHTTLAEIGVAMELVLETDTPTLFLDLKELLFEKSDPCQVIDITNRFHQKPLQPELSVYDTLIPKKGKNKT